MARVLVSFLGTGPFEGKESRNYRNAKYKIDAKMYETPFVSAALVEHLKIEKKIIIGTVKSMWEEYYRFFYFNTDVYDEKLYNRLIDYTNNANAQTTDTAILEELDKAMLDTDIIIIKYGLNEGELKENIARVLKIDELLDRKDGLYMDITHGFRSFPLLAQQIVFYLKEVSSKNIKPRTFYYGMLDAIRELGYAPIVDLKLMFEMNDWIIGANQLVVSNNGDKIVQLLKSKDEELALLIEKFSDALSINYMTEIQNVLEEVKSYDISNISLPEKLIVSKVLMEFRSHFEVIKNNSDFQIKLAQWFYNKKKYSSAYIALSEAIVTWVCEQENYNSLLKENRDIAKNLITKKYNFKNTYSTISNIRNNIAHSLKGRSNSMEKDIYDFRKYIKLFKKTFNQ